MTDTCSRIVRSTGCPYRKEFCLVVDTDEDTVAEIEAMAKRDGVSIAETVRLLVEWGLMADADERKPKRTAYVATATAVH